MIKLNERSLVLFFALYLILLKIYFLYLNPISIGSNVIALNSHIFFNAKSFQYIPQSFHDWNHPGTPIYYLTNLISIFIGGLHVKNFETFLFVFHIITYLFNILAIFYFVHFFKKKIELKNLFVFILIFFSFDTNLLAIENIDYTAFQLPLTFFIIISTVKCLEEPNNKNLFLLSLILSLSISIIMVFLPYLLSIFIIFFNQLVLITKKIKKFFIFTIFFIVNLIIFNFPILGRMPKIFYNVLFSRKDTTFNFFESFFLLKSSIITLINQNIFLFFLVSVFISYVFFEILKKIYYFGLRNIFDSKSFLIILITFFFIYTFIVASKDTNQNWNIQGIFFRNTYIYSSFILLSFFWIEKNKFYNSIKYFLILVSTISFLFTNVNYISKRINNSKINNQNKLNFKKNLEKYTSSADQILIYSDTGYAFENFNILSRANSVFAGDKFTAELIDQYPELRYLRIHDIVHNNFEKLSRIQKNKFYDNIDKKIKKFLPYKWYLILSHKSFHETGGSFTDPNRSKKVYIKNKKKIIDDVNLVIFNNSHIIKNIDVKKIISHIKTSTNLKKSSKFRIGGDTWFVIY